MERIHIFLLLTSINLVLSTPLDREWQNWKLKHSKLYENDADEIYRKDIWNRTYQYIMENNKLSHSFKLGLNEFADRVRNSY